jgi:PBP1b-binding outer membrane lipoprotein LpoB
LINPKKALQNMKKLALLFIIGLLFAACSAEKDTTAQQVAADNVNNGSNDPYYQLQESEAKKHKDSAPPAN